MKAGAFKNQFHEKRKLIAPLTLLAVWAAFQVLMGNWLYALTLAGLFLLWIIIRPPSFKLLALAAILLVFFNTPILDGWSRLGQAGRGALANPTSTLTRFFRPNAGLEALPPPARAAVTLLRDHQVDRYILSARFTQDELLRQRVIEAAWPSRLDTGAEFRLVFITELAEVHPCQAVAQEQDVALVRCP
jgi:hypothetical protein